MQSISINKLNSVLISLLIFFVSSQCKIAVAEDWGCDGIYGNINVVKVISNPEELLAGSLIDPELTGADDCGLQTHSGSSSSQATLAYALETTTNLMEMSFIMDFSNTVINEGALVNFSQLESGSGSSQVLLLDLTLTRSNGDLLLMADWYQPDPVQFGVSLVQSDTFNISDYTVDDVITLDFEWDSGLASLTLVESGVSSVLSDGHGDSPTVFQIGLFAQTGIGSAGDLYRIDEVYMNLVD